MYKKYADFFSGEYNISLSINQFIINELPPSKRYGNIFTQPCNNYSLYNSRFSRKIWCSTKKAPPVTVLEPVMKEISLLETEGVVMSV